MKDQTPNALIRETSPYLLQHAYNPVAWLPWNAETLALAREKDKPLLISIGYAACHWCHVMERECFENPEVAEVMNTLYIPVKVDREERPDVDQIYMDALQLMTGSGGWPLNIVALPDGQPFWGATYVPPEKWISALVQLGRLYREDRAKVTEYAADLTSAVRRINLQEHETDTGLPDLEALALWVENWKPRFDPVYGGNQGAPKFMMPVTLRFLLHYSQCREDEAIEAHIRRTLDRMFQGGVYDHVGGGFSRYSVDARWHVPHFEKMLYDNAQLLSLYAEAYGHYRDPAYRHVAEGILNFVSTELKAPSGGYYASLDADSTDPEGALVEGAYYRWRQSELREVLGPDYDAFAKVFHISPEGHWEEGYYVLMRQHPDLETARILGMDLEAFTSWLEQCRTRLMERRNRRPYPRLDTKLLVSWNGLWLSGLADASRYCGLDAAGSSALELGEYLASLMGPDGSLPHQVANGTAKGRGFLEDYAAVSEGFIRLYSLTLDPQWMERAHRLATHVIQAFGEEDQALFYFTSKDDPELIRRSLEVADNVIPASNSMMAESLYRLGLFFGNTAWTDRAADMLRQVTASVAKYSGQHANWLRLALMLKSPFHEVVVSGPDAPRLAGEIGAHYLPQTLLAGSSGPSEHLLFLNRYLEGETRIFICEKGMCHRPLTRVEDALRTLS